MREENLRLKKGDFIAFFAVLALAAGVFIGFVLKTGNQDAVAVRAYQNGQLLWEKPLNVDGTFKISGDYTNIVTISEGKVSITASTCPGEDCVHLGEISAAGQSVVCLPNRVEVRIVGGAEEGQGGYDIAVG